MSQKYFHLVSNLFIFLSQNGVINKFKILDKFRDVYDVEIPLDVLE